MLIHRRTHNGILHVIIYRSNSSGNKLKSQQQFRELMENKVPMIKMDLEDDSAQTEPSQHWLGKQMQMRSLHKCVQKHNELRLMKWDAYAASCTVT